MDIKKARKKAYTKETWNSKTRKKVTLPDQGKRGFSFFELALIIGVIVVFFGAGAVFFRTTSKSAYEITVKHDLQAFADFQDYYYKLNKRCVGEQGQSIRNDGVPSDLPLENYSVSEGVCITIISGDPANPNDPDNPYTFQAIHDKSDKVYEYNFQSGRMIER